MSRTGPGRSPVPRSGDRAPLGRNPGSSACNLSQHPRRRRLCTAPSGFWHNRRRRWEDGSVPRMPSVVEDRTALDGARIEVAARIGWLLRVSRTGSGIPLRSMAAELRSLGVDTSASALSRLESEGRRHGSVVDGYEQVLGLAPGRLRAAIDVLCRTFDNAPPDEDPDLGPSTLDGFSAAVEAVLDGRAGRRGLAALRARALRRARVRPDGRPDGAAGGPPGRRDGSVGGAGVHDSLRGAQPTALRPVRRRGRGRRPRLRPGTGHPGPHRPDDRAGGTAHAGRPGLGR